MAIFAAVLAAGFVATPAATAGAAAKTNTDPASKASSEQTQAVEDVATADRLVAYGDAHRDALSLIAAARILKASGVRHARATKKTEGSGKKDAQHKEDKDQTVAGILARAKQYAAGNKALIALAEDVAASSTKGRVGGPGRATSRVYGGYTDTWTITFEGGEPAIVAIRGDGDTDLDFYVYDENGNLIARDTDGTDYTLLRWTPRWTGKFYIKVKNLGHVYNQYVIATN
ncbi:MAG: hypothetical protein D6698_07905 [Gammaproteobacteria bacterium]|nr:MAG: hypothetical protein D6698_07905 [Gammaproteobacteria bacterium]